MELFGHHLFLDLLSKKDLMPGLIKAKLAKLKYPKEYYFGRVYYIRRCNSICNVTRAAIYCWQKSGRITLYNKRSRTVVKRSDIKEIKKKNEEIRPFK